MFMLILLLLLFLILYKSIIYPTCLSPLANVPNAHFLSPITSLWILWRRYRGQEIHTVNEAFQRKGPVVRLGPNELSVNIVDGGIRTVHGGGFAKTEWYDFFMNSGSVYPVTGAKVDFRTVLIMARTRNTFSSLGAGEHVQYRRRSAIIYAKSCIQRSPHVRKIVCTILLQRYMSIIRKSVQSGTASEILNLDFAYGLDFVSAFIFGLPRSSNFIENVKARDYWLVAYLKSHPADHMFWPLELPVLTAWLKKVGISVIPKWSSEAHDALDQWSLEMVDKTEDAIAKQSALDMSAGDCPVVYNQLRLALLEEQQKDEQDTKTAISGQQRLQLASECLDHLGIYSFF